MILNDIWRNVNKEIGFYTRGTFEKVPRDPGIYAWFYPLRVTTKDPYEFIKEVNTVLNYDAIIEDKRSVCLDQDKSIKLSWEEISLKFDLNFKTPNLENFIHIWNEAVNEEKSYDHLRSIIMKASILMPPLYVGKTNNLYVRCHQHINGNDAKNSFYRRYHDFALKNNIKKNLVSDLLFVSIKTIEENHNDETISKNLEALVEEIMKYIAKPAYSKK